MTLSIYHYHHRSGLVLLLIAVLLAIQNCPASGLRYPSVSSLSEDDEHYHVSPLDTGKTYFLKRGDSFFVATQSALNLQNALPLGSYTVGFDGFLQEYFLKPILPFDLEGTKLYGDTVHHGQRILQTFQARTGQSTGVLLAGQKGSGKTLLAKYISVEAAKRGISTIVINEPWSGEGFNTFIQAIQQPAIVLFDEFEKVYRQSMDAELAESNRQRENGYYSHHCDDDGGLSNPSQDAILTLLDGVYPSTMLFVLTVNDKSKITSNMMNRPGRIYYVLDFSGLEPDFIHDYCQDQLVNTTHTSEVVAFASLFEAFSFDMLQALVAEMNLYSENPDKAVQWLNIKLDTVDSKIETYLIRKLVVKGQDITSKINHPTWRGNPATSDLVSIHVYHQGWLGYKDWEVQFSPQNHLISGNVTSGEFVFEDDLRKSKAVLMRSQGKSQMAMAKLLVH